MVEDIGRLLAEEAEAADEHRDDDVPLVRSRRPAKKLGPPSTGLARPTIEVAGEDAVGEERGSGEE